MVRAEGLSHRYGTRQALDNLSFEVPRGAIFGVLGPNGGGKSTLFRILSTMMVPTAGSASIAGFNVVRQACEVRRNIGVVFQTNSFDKKLTVRENLMLQGRLHGLRSADLKQRIGAGLEAVGLAQRDAELAGALSGGMQRRLEIAKALLHRPPVILLDEPSSGLDPLARRELWQHVERLRASGATIVLTTHLLDEADRCDYIVLLHRGQKVTEGAPADLKRKVGGDVVVLEAEGIEPELRARFGVTPHTVNGTIRVEIPDGHRFVPAVMEAFPGVISSVALHKPTLEDVFISETGTQFEEASE